MTDLVVLYETAHQVASASSLHKPGTEFVALTPEAAWALQQSELHYQKLEDFYDLPEMVRQHNIVMATSLEWIEWVDAYLQKAFDIFADHNFRPAHLFAGELLRFFDELFAVQYKLNALLTQLKPRRVLYETGSMYPTAFDQLGFMPQRLAYSSLLPIVARSFGIETRAISKISSSVVPDKLVKLENTSLQQHPGLSLGFVKRMVKSFYKGLPPRLKAELRVLNILGLFHYALNLSRSHKKSSHRRVLVLGGSYDLPPVIKGLIIRGCGVNIIPEVQAVKYPQSCQSICLQARLEEEWKRVCNESQFWKPLEIWRIEPTELVEEALHFWWGELIQQMWRTFEAFRKHFARRQYGAVLNWSAGAGLNNVVLAASQSAGIPTFSYQHGSSARINVDYWIVTELLHSDYFFVYGKGTKKLLCSRQKYLSKRTSGQPIAVGSARLDALRGGKSSRFVWSMKRRLIRKSDSPIVLYAPTHYGEHGFSMSSLPDVTYFELQQRVVELFASFPNVCFVYKEFPSKTLPNPIPQIISQQIPNGIVISDIPFVDLMWVADFILLDEDSTALNEALLTEKPIVLYDRGSQYEWLVPHGSRELLRRRVLVANSVDDFVTLIRTVLESGEFSNFVELDTEFRKYFGTHLDDGKSADRAAEHILSVSDRKGSLPT